MISLKFNTYYFFKLLLFITVLFCTVNSYAQPNLPQRTITVLPTKPIDFGVFYINGAGTINVDYQGAVTTTGGVVSLNTMSVTPAIFEITLCQGRNVTIDFDYSVFINGSNGGNLELVIGSARREGIGTELFNGSTFSVATNCNFITILRVGGTLVVPENTLPGFYSGSFPITFTQQ